MKLVADENVPRPVIERLRLDGFAIVSIAEVDPGRADVAVMHEAEDRAFVLMTHDRDFGELAIRQGLPVNGVILLEVERLSLPAQVERVSLCLASPETDWIGNFSVIEPARVRRRAIPVS